MVTNSKNNPLSLTFLECPKTHLISKSAPHFLHFLHFGTINTTPSVKLKISLLINNQFNNPDM